MHFIDHFRVYQQLKLLLFDLIFFYKFIVRIVVIY